MRCMITGSVHHDDRVLNVGDYLDAAKEVVEALVEAGGAELVAEPVKAKAKADKQPALPAE